MMETPRPVPVFYSGVNSNSFSTKKERKTPLYNAASSSRPIAKTAPPVSRLFSRAKGPSFIIQKPKTITFKNHSSENLSYRFYNENEKESYFEQAFTVVCKVGQGAFGEVFKVRSKEDGRVYAVKKSLETFRSATDRVEKLSEVQKHEQLPKHANLVKFVKAWEERGYLYIQTELCKTSLFCYCEVYHELPQSVIWNYLVDLLLAVKHLHDHDLIHLDIKPDNIFISEDGICKLGDFGLVTDLSSRSWMENDGGDSRYLAPELLENIVGKHVDIFSLGVTILEVACDLEVPKEGDLWQMLRHGSLPENLLNQLSPDLRNIIRLMMIPDYKKRPSATDILNLPKVRKLAKIRQLFCAYRKIVNTLNGMFLLLWVFAVCFARFTRKTFARFTFFRFQRKKFTNGRMAVSTGTKRKHVVLSPESEFSPPRAIARRLNFSDDSLEEDHIKQEICFR